MQIVPYSTLTYTTGQVVLDGNLCIRSHSYGICCLEIRYCQRSGFSMDIEPVSDLVAIPFLILTPNNES